jgi:multidrug efflux pump
MLVSGMIIGTIFTLFVVPSIYVLLARKHRAIEAETRVPEDVDHRAGELQPV